MFHPGSKRHQARKYRSHCLIHLLYYKHDATMQQPFLVTVLPTGDDTTVVK